MTDEALLPRSSLRMSREAHAWPSRKPLPPYGRQWIEAGAKYGPFVICGPGAWDMAKRRKRCGFALVAPDDRDPLDFDWSLLNGRETVLIESGGFDTPKLERVVFALLAAGVPLVFPIRTVMLDRDPPQVWPSYSRDDYVCPL